MLYLGAYDADERLCAGVFVRNSGTEEKTGINVRGRAMMAAALDGVGEAALRVVMRELKDADHPYARAERRLLERLARSAPCEEAEMLALVTELDDAINGERLIDEMEKKQELLRRTAEGYSLTPLGAWYAELRDEA